jgi:hypothetical protein
MARLVLSAAVLPTMRDVRLIVSVSGADDGLPRSGLAATNFDVVMLPSEADTGPQQQLIAQAVEGPSGVYHLVLEGHAQPPMLVAQMFVFAMTVSGATESGWADDRGQTLAVGTMP